MRKRHGLRSFVQLRVAQINLQSNLSFFAFKSAVAALRSAIGLPALCPHPPPAHIPTCIHTFTHTIECSARGGGQGCCTPSAQHPNVAPTELYCALSRWGAQQTLSTALSPWLNTFYLHFLLYCSLLLALSSDCTPTRSGAAPCGCSLPYTQRMHDPI